MLTTTRGTINVSGPGGVWSGPSRTGNVHCGQMNHYSKSLLEEMGTMCSREKKRGWGGTIQTIINEWV